MINWFPQWVCCITGLTIAKMSCLDTYLQDNCEGPSAIEHRLKEVEKDVHHLAGAKLVDKLETHLHFKVSTEAEPRLSTLFAYLEV